MTSYFYNAQIARLTDFYRALTIQPGGHVNTSERFPYYIEACNHNSTHVYGYNFWCELRSLTNLVLLTMPPILHKKLIFVLR